MNIHAYIDTCIHRHMHTYMHTTTYEDAKSVLAAFVCPIFIHAYIDTCIHRHMHIYMHTGMTYEKAKSVLATFVCPMRAAICRGVDIVRSCEPKYEY